MQAPTAPLFRQTLSRFATGVSVITSTHAGQAQGVTINSLASVSLDPPLVLFSLKKHSPRYAFFLESKEYAISILSEQQQALSDHFARYGTILETFPRIEGEALPLFKGALAHLKGTQEAIYEGGDHSIFILRITGLDYDATKKPLLFYASHYQSMEALSPQSI